MLRKLSLILLALLLLTFTAYAQAPETNDAGEIDVGDSAEGTFEPGVRDRYTVNVGDVTSVNIFLDGSEDTDTYLRVYREGEDEPFAENDDRGDGTLFSALEGLGVSEGDVLIVEVGTFADVGEGDYTLRVTPPPTIEDKAEIALGDTVEATLEENSRHRYTLIVDETTTLRIVLEGADDLDTYLRLYTEGEDKPAAQNDDVEAGNAAAGFTALVIPGRTTLVIEAGVYGDTAGGDYTLMVDETDLDVAEAAAPVALGNQTLAEVCEGAEASDEPVRLQYLVADEALESGVDYGAVFCTEAGNFLIDLYEEEAPITVNSFVYLATNHFFDQTTFHRVIEDFVVQGGDPTGEGSGGPGYEFVNETDNDLTFGGIGVVGMANAGPDTNGSQFFITLAPVARLDGGYTIFGQVLEGMGSVFDIEVRDPGTATEPGTALYSVRIVTLG
jgi:cyclophilin family peptidyl-prolyl cis-trans isomerase